MVPLLALTWQSSGKHMTEREPFVPHPMYTGGALTDVEDKITFDDVIDTGCSEKVPIRFNVVKPKDPETGVQRDQTVDAANNMRYAATLDIPTLTSRSTPRFGRAIIVGGAPSVGDYLDQIKELAKDPHNEIFAVNWTHTWLLKQGIVPKHCVFFEIDPEPDSVILQPHPDITYYICCHCHRKTFDSLKGYKRVLWHTHPNSNIEKDVNEELFPNAQLVGGGTSTFTRTISVGMFLGFRHFDIFGCDSSFPDSTKSTHVDGYETGADPGEDGMFLYAKDFDTGEVRRYRTTAPLALQAEEFKHFCATNHAFFSMKVYGDSLLRFCHMAGWRNQYD